MALRMNQIPLRSSGACLPWRFRRANSCILFIFLHQTEWLAGCRWLINFCRNADWILSAQTTRQNSAYTCARNKNWCMPTTSPGSWKKTRQQMTTLSGLGERSSRKLFWLQPVLPYSILIASWQYLGYFSIFCTLWAFFWVHLPLWGHTVAGYE